MKSLLLPISLFAFCLPHAKAQEPTGPNNIESLLERIREYERSLVPPTPEQQQMKIIQELSIDRSPAGILETKLQEARNIGNEIKPLPENPTPEQKLEHFSQTVEILRRDITLSRWDKVAEFFATQPKPISEKTYGIVIGKLVAPIQVNPPPEIAAKGAKPHTQQTYLPAVDWLGLASAAPNPPSSPLLKSLAKLLSRDVDPPADFFKALASGIPNFGGSDPENRRRAAELLIEANFLDEAAQFLPEINEDRAKADYQAINLIARHRAAIAKKQPHASAKQSLQLAWELSTSFLADKKAPLEARAEALYRALSLIPELDDKRGQDWLKKTFATPEGSGLELLATLGTITAQNRSNPSQESRLADLRLQHAAVKAMMASDVDLKPWSGIFTLFADQWAFEAEISGRLDQSVSRRMLPQYDDYGNFYFSQRNARVPNQQSTSHISSADMLDCRPDSTWLSNIEESVRHKCTVYTANLFLNVKEEQNAIPLIKPIAATHPEESAKLVHQIIKVWADNNNPNSEEEYRSRYMYFYGYNQKTGSIPLTRSKQERNLVELASLVKSIRELGLKESFHKELADALIACHSKAEVWRVEAIESVFGSADALDSATLAELTDRMRANLAGLWPNPKLQEAYKTKRKDSELQEQILFGYSAAASVLERALAKNPSDAWRLSSQLAALRFDESNYRSSIAPDNSHSATKNESLRKFAEAASAYAATLPREDSTTESSEVFELWLFAAIGSPTLEALKSEHLPTPSEYQKIKTALESLPSDAAERHIKSFANNLNNRLANVGPELKLRYLEAVTTVCPDRKELSDAADVFAYYRDLITEIELSTQIDGSDTITPDKPFGLKVNIRHTREIERESGGFQRYLQNQNNATYAYNFGRPTEDYRDKFEKPARAALEEHFEIISITFHSEKVESRTDSRFGWRLTPYAYFLLKPKGPQVDRIPPLKIDLDFMDTSGYAVIPISSGEIPIKVATPTTPPPFRELRVTQTLDERSHSEKGLIVLEIRATCLGLVPSLETLIDTTIDGFTIESIEHSGLRIAELDANTDELAPLSEAEWRLKLKPTGGNLPTNFRFPKLKMETAQEDGLLLQRYVDVDLVPVSAETPMQIKKRLPYLWISAGIAILCGIGGLLAWRTLRRTQPPESITGIPIPSRLTPVSLLGYLQRLDVAADRRADLEREIRLLQETHFGPAATCDSASLTEIATRWQATTCL